MIAAPTSPFLNRVAQEFGRDVENTGRGILYVESDLGMRLAFYEENKAVIIPLAKLTEQQRRQILPHAALVAWRLREGDRIPCSCSAKGACVYIIPE